MARIRRAGKGTSVAPRRGVYFVITSLLPAVLNLLHPGCQRDPGASSGGPPSSSASAAPATAVALEVEVGEVRRTAMSLRVEIVGTLHAADEALISTKTEGVLRRTFVEVGAEVDPGTPLAQVDRVSYEVAVAAAEAALSETLARLGTPDVPDETFDLTEVSAVQRATAQFENAKYTYERLSRLGTTVAEQELNDAAARLRVTEADRRLALDEAAALAATAGERAALLRSARQKLTDTLTPAPPLPTTLGREGAQRWVVAERLVTEGQYVNVAEALYRLIVMDPLKLRSRVPERYAGVVRVGQAVELETLGRTAPVVGRITRISPDIEASSRTFEVEALVDNDGGATKAGTFATGVIVAEDETPVLVVSAEAIARVGGVTRVAVVKDGTATWREIRSGRESKLEVEVLSGVEEGERVILRPNSALRDGIRVAEKQR